MTTENPKEEIEMTNEKRKADELLKQKDFSELVKVIEENFSLPKQLIFEEENFYQHQFVFSVEDPFFEKVEGIVKFEFSLSKNNKEVITADCVFTVNNVYTEANDKYYYTKNKVSMGKLNAAIDQVVREFKEQTEIDVYVVNIVPEKILPFLMMYSNPEAFMQNEEIFLATTHHPIFKEVEKEVKSVNEENDSKMEKLVAQFEKQNWQNQVDIALEQKDFETLKKLTKQTVSA